MERPDDFDSRRAHLQAMSEPELHDYFWELVQKIVAPLIDEARTHTTPSIERSVLLRMGFNSLETKALVEQFSKRSLLGQGAGHLVLQLAKAKNTSVGEAGRALLADKYWDFFEK